MQKKFTFSDNALKLLEEFKKEYPNCESDIEAIRLALALGVKKQEPITINLNTERIKKEKTLEEKKIDLDTMPQTKERLEKIERENEKCWVCYLPIDSPTCNHFGSDEFIARVARNYKEWIE